jgi:hypothetical protein
VRKPPRRLALPVALGALAVLLWDTFPAYPFRLFVVLLHEISHGIAAVLTGGRIVAIGLNFREGGVCVTQGGWRFVILNAGYLGSLLWGALFLVLGEKRRRAPTVVALIGAFTLVATLVYVRTWFGLLYGSVAGIALMAVATRLARRHELPLRGVGRGLGRAPAQPPRLRRLRSRRPDRRSRRPVGHGLGRGVAVGHRRRAAAARLSREEDSR